MLEIKKNDILINIFDDNTSVYKYIKETPKRKYAESASTERESSFTGTKNFEEAVDLFRFGDEELFKRIKNNIKNINTEKLMGNVKNKRKSYDDLVGFQANVPAFLTNNPINMLNITPKKENTRVLNIVLVTTVSSGVSTSQVEKVGSTYLAVLDILEKLGYRCNLYVGDCSLNKRCSKQVKKFHMLTRIKTDREPLNLKKMVFPLCHASMQRRIAFAWVERCNLNKEKINCVDDDITDNGYGQPFEDNKLLKKDLSELTKTDFIVWSYQGNGIDVSVENVLKNLQKSGINIDLEL